MMEEHRSPVHIDLRGGISVPTFDIADAADSHTYPAINVGATLSYTGSRARSACS